MNFGKYKEYLKYRKQAKTQHGVHSPFVFSFTREVLLSEGAISVFALDRFLPVKAIEMPERQKQLLFHILKHFKCERILTFTENVQGKVEMYVGLENKGSELQPLESYQSDCMLFILKNPHAWASLYGMYGHTLTTNSMMIAADIHESSEHSKTWEAFHSIKKISLSLDVYYFGLLFFKDAFKEKQHFVLKYKR